MEKILISADALWENGFGVVFPELEGADAFTEVATTLDLIERLDPKMGIPGHGRVFAYIPEVLARSRQRLAVFAKNPFKHVHHAVKVLIKFKLLEVQKQTFQEFAQWAVTTPYLMQTREKFFSDSPASPWIAQLCDELVKLGVARREGAYILNA